MNSRFGRFVLAGSAALWLSLGLAAQAQAKGMSLIRDAEIESTLRRYANPIFKSAGLNPEAVRLFIVHSDNVNAFVAGGANVFIHTGLIRECETADMLIGVIAHETGHIAGGHLARGTEKLRNAQIGAILTYVLGAAAGVGGGGDAAAAIIAGGQNLLQRNVMSFTRANEQAADQAALDYLDDNGISASGMARVFEILRRNERRRGGVPDPYAMTHPLNSERIDHVEHHVVNSPIAKNSYPPEFKIWHERMLAKLTSFLDTPEKTLMRYPISRRDMPARIARAVAYYKMPDLPKALAEINGLIAQNPQDAYLHELKGQILFENGKITDALTAYHKAAELKPEAALILISLAEVEMSTGTAERLKSAIGHLERASATEQTNGKLWRLLARAYGKNGEIGKSSLALAEEAALADDDKAISKHAGAALAKLPRGSASYLRAQDLKNMAAQIRKKREEE